MKTRIAFFLLLTAPVWAADWDTVSRRGVEADRAFTAAQKQLHGWLRHADPKTLLLPDRLGQTVYTPHNSAADNYPYLILAAWFTDRGLFDGRMMDMLRNEIRFTNTKGSRIPGNYDFTTGVLGEPSLFGAGEYAKDGLTPVTEWLGESPWYYRMLDMMRGVRLRAPRDNGAELDGDFMQALFRLIPMSGDRELLAWSRAISDYYLREVLPRNGDLPHTRLRDHGNEAIVGLVLLHALYSEMGLDGIERDRVVIRRMLDRVLASANPDGMLYNDVRKTDERLSDNWGYVYSAAYAFHQLTGEPRWREAATKVLANLPRYRKYDWERGSMDGYADTIEGALYLVNREPVAEALGWIESEMQILFAYQKPDGVLERWYGDGNFTRTTLLYALMKTQGCSLDGWRPGVELGAVREGSQLVVGIRSATPWTGKLRLDWARHGRILHLKKNYARLNEWPEWFTVDETRLYRIQTAAGGEEIRLGSELKAGIAVSAGARLTISPL